MKDSSKPRVGLVTCLRSPELTADDRLFAEALEARGLCGVAVPWDGESVDWSDFSAVIPRSCWDYHERIEEFLGWLGRLDVGSARVWNSTALLRWNSHKGYLRDCEAWGRSIVPTLWVDRGVGADLFALLDERGWEESVVKPAISASAFETFRVPSKGEPEERAVAQSRFSRLQQRGDVMVQPFVEEVVTEGEISVTLFEGEVSHGVLKRPKAGDYRVQEELGGVPIPWSPTDDVAIHAREIVADLPELPLYARVDLVRYRGVLSLTELEVIEPCLYLAAGPESASRFADAVASRLRERS